MRLKDAQSLVDRCFAGMAEGAARLYEPAEPRFEARPSAALLSERARGALEGGTPSPERILGVFGDDGVRRECVSFGATSLTVEHWEKAGPCELLGEERFQALAGLLASADSTPEERHEAVQRIAVERSERVVAVLLGLLEARSSLMALRVLSEWGEVRARAPLRRALEQVPPDNPADLWALTALDRRLEAWEAVALSQSAQNPSV